MLHHQVNVSIIRPLDTKKIVNLKYMWPGSVSFWGKEVGTYCYSAARNMPWGHGPLDRYVKLRFAHAPGMPGTFSPPPRVSDPDMHHGTCVTHVPCCMSGSLTIGFLWIQWRGKRSRHSRRMRNLQLYISGKRPMLVMGNSKSHLS